MTETPAQIQVPAPVVAETPAPKPAAAVEARRSVPVAGEGRDVIAQKAKEVPEPKKETANPAPAETNLTKMEAMLSAKKVPLERLSPEAQRLFTELNEATKKTGQDPAQFTDRFQAFLTRMNTEIKEKNPDAFKYFEDIRQGIADKKMTPDAVWDELTMVVKKEDPEAAKQIEEVRAAVAEVQEKARKEGRKLDASIFKKFDFGRLVKIFGIGIIAILALLLFQGMTTGGAMTRG